MANCTSQKFVGRDAVLEYAIGCPDDNPETLVFSRLGAMRTKEMTLAWDTADTTADDSIGSLRENLATFQTLSVSGDGTVKASGNGAAALIALTKHVINPTLTGGQPFAWIRLTFPDLTFTFFAIVNNMSRSAPYDDVVTYSFEAQATSSDLGLIVEDTPVAGSDPVTNVSVTPASASIAVGATVTLTATAAPGTADQRVTWSSADGAIATVSSTGVVTGVAAGGPVLIIATSVDDPTKTDTSSITVTL